jgi:hypothetical protein
MKKINPAILDKPFKPHSRREFLRKAAYASPVLLTLPAAPSLAQQGSGSVGPGDPGDPGNPGNPTGARPASEIDCNQPLTPFNSDAARSMCELTLDPVDNQTVLFEDVIVPTDAVPGQIARGNLLGTCDAFVCNAS